MNFHRYFFSGLIWAILLGIGCQTPNSRSQSSPLLPSKDVSRIVLVGGTLISGMEEYGFFEQSMLRHFAAEKISFRNIGWPADDVYGLARSQFGSAQNTQSWQPPTAEEGFGSKVLIDHITEAQPSTLFIGYGSEAAFCANEKDFELFTSGYKRLLDVAEEQGRTLILLSPPKHEQVFISIEELERRNEWLAKVHEFIQGQANKRDHLFIDLYTTLISDPTQQTYTQNGVQLNREGYEKMNRLLLDQLGIPHISNFKVALDKEGQVIEKAHCDISDVTATVNGVSFHLTPGEMLHAGQFTSKTPVAIYVNGQLVSNNQDTIAHIQLRHDSLQQDRLLATIKEKNRLHRYRLRPLNEAYIYLFRRHEMGHLAYEMDDLTALVSEKEREITHLMPTQTYFVEVEMIKPWEPPKNYPEDEVPAFVPEPNIDKELEAFKLSDEFEMSLFASDPMIANPINVNWDTKGRAWVATSSTYPHIVPGREPNDKIVILEDTDGDGKADKHTIFAENLLVPHSVMPVPGGAYVAATTELLFLADTDGDDVADERRVVLGGFGNADVHHMIHGLRWMPWGDLHVTQSIYINSFIETAYGIRVLNGSGIWSFRPETERLEVFSRGLINPWGEAIDEWGQTFATDGAGSSGINYLFPESAHATAVGAPAVLPGLNHSTPKNTAAEVIYSRHFPPSWQGSIITHDFRANRTVRYQINPEGSGYKSREVETVLRSDHRSYRPVDSKIGPDGALYIVDWYNPIIDHGEVDFHHPIRDRSHGRIWKLTHRLRPLLSPVSFYEKSPAQLLELLKSPEQFTRIQANRAFVEKDGDPQLVLDWLRGISTNDPNAARHRLEGLWLLAALNHYHATVHRTSLQSASYQERAAAIRMLAHWQKQAEFADELQQLINDTHPQVRLEAIHALREMGNMAASEMVVQVLDHTMDENLTFALDKSLRDMEDQWLPAILEGQAIFNHSADKQLYALLTSEDARIIAPINERLKNTSIAPDLADRAWKLMAKIGDDETRALVLQKALTEKDASLLRVMANAPAAYHAVPNDLSSLSELLHHDDPSLRKAAIQLVGRWKANEFLPILTAHFLQTEDISEKLTILDNMAAIGALEQVKQIAQQHTDPINQTAATAIWIEKAPEEATPHAINVLNQLDDPQLAEALFLSYRKLERGPHILSEALAGKRIPEPVASVGLKVVQTSGLNLQELDEAIRTAGDIQPVGVDMTEQEKDQLIEEAVASGDRWRGRQIYRRKELLCATCHRIEGIGGLLGPNLTTVGSYMTPNSILESILNPNADIKQNYETLLITLNHGEVISGLLHRKTNNATLIRRPNGDIQEIPAEEIAKTDVSSVSLMPAGLTNHLHKDELKDLLSYLFHLGK